ncbi:nucleoid-associated protein [Serratia marcescens]|nr:nucleoid-associated protein [Serratia marcescens]
MSTPQIHNFIVHQIVRDSSKAAFLKSRKEENTVDEMTTQVVTSLLTLFNKTGLQTGSFSQQGGKPKFEQVLIKNCSKISSEFKFDNFTQMTVDLARLLEGEMNKGAGKAARPNYVVFFHHSSNGKSYLSVITLLETKSFTLQELSFKYIERLDLDKLHLAARIRLDDWVDEMETDRYISFRIGRNSEMRDYFKDFIGCEEFTEAKLETKELVDAIKKCCAELFSLEPIKITEALELAAKYCKENKDHDGKVSLISLGKHLFPDHDDYLLKTAQGEPFNLSERVSIDNRGLGALVRYRGSNKKMSISFDADLLKSKKVEYIDGKLIFNEIPKDLKSSLDKD